MATLFLAERKGISHKRDAVDGHADVEHDHLYIQCKRRQKIAVARHLDEAVASEREAEEIHHVSKTPIVVMREDQGKNMVLMRIEDFLEMFDDHRMWRRNLFENDML